MATRDTQSAEGSTQRKVLKPKKAKVSAKKAKTGGAEPGKVATAGKGKQRAEPVDDPEDEGAEGEEEEEEEEEVAEEEGGGTTMEINDVDTMCNQAVVSICRIDLFDPPAKIQFGRWNKRPLVEKEAKKLATSISMSKFRPFATGNLLPLIIPRTALHPSCIQLSHDVEAAPMLELTEEAKASGALLNFAGGRHRQRATKILQDRMTERIGTMEEKQSKLMKGELKGGEAKIGMLEEMLEKERAIRDKIGIWGVIVYDEELMLKDGERGARHLSGNVYTHRYNEGPAEKLDAWCMDYKSVQENGGDKALKGWISTNAKEKNSKLGQIFNHAETRNYLTAVLEFRPHFNVDDIFSVNFCVDKLHNVNGAVLVRTVEHGLKIVRGLFTNSACELGEDEGLLERYMEKRRTGNESSDKKWRLIVGRSWNALCQAQESKYAKEIAMGQIDEFDRIFETHFAKAGQFFMTSGQAWKDTWPTYVEAVTRHASTLGERPESDKELVKICEAAEGKVRFAMTDHEGFHVAPPFPILTRSVLAMMVNALDGIGDATREFWSWFDWSANYLVPRPVNHYPKDISAWVFRTIMFNGKGPSNIAPWDNPKKAVDILTFFVWRHLDYFIGMQHYIDTHPIPPRPAFNHLHTKHVKQLYYAAFAADPSITTKMLNIRLKRSSDLTAGLWPLDVVSWCGWLNFDRSATKAVSDFLVMAKIEASLIAGYRSDLLAHCPEAAFIRGRAASDLGDACPSRPWTTFNKETNKNESPLQRKFVYADKIALPHTMDSGPPSVDVQTLLSKRKSTARAISLSAEAASALKKLESLKGAAATPNSKEIDPAISESVTLLKSLFTENIARLEKMHQALADDHRAVLDPRLELYLPDPSDLPPLNFNRRPAFTPPTLRHRSGHESSSPLSDGSGQKPDQSETEPESEHSVDKAPLATPPLSSFNFSETPMDIEDDGPATSQGATVEESCPNPTKRARSTTVGSPEATKKKKTRWADSQGAESGACSSSDSHSSAGDEDETQPTKLPLPPPRSSRSRR